MNEHKLVSIKFKTNFIRLIYHAKGEFNEINVTYATLGGDYICCQMSIYVPQ